MNKTTYLPNVGSAKNMIQNEVKLTATIVACLILFLGLAPSWAQTKVGENATNVSTSLHLEVEAQDGKRVSITKPQTKMGVGTLSPQNTVEVDSGVTGQSGLTLSQIPSQIGLATDDAGDVVGVGTSDLCVCGDVKSSMLSTAHGYWVPMTGGGIPSFGAACATTLSLGGIPNLADKVLMNAALASSGGAASVSLTVANLPVLFAQGVSNNPSLEHTHTFPDGGVHSHSALGDGAFLKNGFDGYVTFRPGVGSSHGFSTRTGSTTTSHSHTVSSAGAHTHTAEIATGGSGTPIDLSPSYLGVTHFICLGGS